MWQGNIPLTHVDVLCALPSQMSHKHNGLIQPRDFHMCPYTWIGPDLVYIQAITLALAPNIIKAKNKY